MNFIDSQLENYCIEASTIPSALCEELAKYTREQVAMSIMLSGRLVASTLGLFIRSIQAKRVVEVGCYTGYSALAMAEALPADGKLTTFDTNPQTMAIAQRFWAQSPHGSKIEGVLGDAQSTLKSLSGEIDFAFIDANKVGYINYFEALWPKLRRGGIIAADNCLYEGMVLNPEQAPDKNAVAIHAYNQFVSQRPDTDTLLLPVRDGIMLARKK